jgi:hypothetical protein
LPPSWKLRKLGMATTIRVKTNATTPNTSTMEYPDFCIQKHYQLAKAMSRQIFEIFLG